MKPSVNQGIIGNVDSDVTAVGPGAKATKTVSSSADSEMQRLLDQIQVELAKLRLSADERESLQMQVEELRTSSSTKTSSEQQHEGVTKFVELLRNAGVVLEATRGIASPLLALVKLWGVPISFP